MSVPHKLQIVFRNMHRRCSNPEDKDFSRYGGRGIKVSEAWGLYMDFALWATSNGYREDLQLDRVDNDKDYGPDNCRFVSAKVNAQNRSTTKFVEAFGETKCVLDWTKDSRCVVGEGTLYYRINAGWPGERALTKPSRLRA